MRYKKCRCISAIFKSKQPLHKAYPHKIMVVCVGECISYASNLLKLMWHFFDIQTHLYILYCDRKLRIYFENLMHIEKKRKLKFYLNV